MDVIDGLIAAQPDPVDPVGAQHAAPLPPQYIRQRGALLTDLGDVLTDQGRYAEARAAYEGGLEVDRQLGDERGQGVSLGQLGSLALRQRDYAEATRRYREALELARSLTEPGLEAIWWHQLGRVAEEQAQSGGAQHAAPLWAEAERCYRESLALKERMGDAAGAARTSNQIAIVAEGAGRPTEAAGWYQRAIAIAEQMNDDKGLATMLNNLANLLLAEVRAGRMGHERLAEARGSAGRALAIMETLDLSAQPWINLATLAGIAELEGQPEQARAYRRRARETFAQFAGNRWHIDRQHGALIRAIAAVAQGDASQRAAIEEMLPQLEAKGWRIADATRRIWAGERDWHALCEGLDRQDALVILRVLETLAEAEAVKG
jgi:tetratricopeptide (TPR) repeat protein